MTDQRETVLDQWRSYRAQVVPMGASTEQVTESRRAFYAGAVAGIMLVSREPHRMRELLDELNAFSESVKHGTDRL